MTTPNGTVNSTQQATFDNDLARMNKALHDGGHITEIQDHGETIKVLSPTTPPDLARAYQGLIQYGYANGLI